MEFVGTYGGLFGVVCYRLFALDLTHCAPVLHEDEDEDYYCICRDHHVIENTNAMCHFPRAFMAIVVDLLLSFLF
jgi:hypothetical protein